MSDKTEKLKNPLLELETFGLNFVRATEPFGSVIKVVNTKHKPPNFVRDRKRRNNFSALGVLAVFSDSPKIIFGKLDSFVREHRDIAIIEHLLTSVNAWRR
jgi:hypothetical protein